MNFKKRREEKEIRERRQAIKERMERDNPYRSNEEQRQQEEEKIQQEKEQMAAMPVNELLVKVFYEMRELRKEVGKIYWMMQENTSDLEKMKKSVSEIEDKVDSLWLNTL